MNREASEHRRKVIAEPTVISRRAAVLGASALTIGSIIGKPTLATAQPKRGGRLRLGLAGGATSDTLDPAKTSDTVPAVVGYQARNLLVELDSSLRIQPELASSWESSPDARIWTFELRKDVEFHNGKPFSAEDVVYSINHHRNPANGSPALGFVKPIVDIKADGKSRVIFTLSGPNADFPFSLSEYRFQIMPVDTKDFRSAIGTGPYVVQSFEPGVRAFAVRNKNYWKSDRAFVDEVETVVIKDNSARTNALLGDQVDVINRVDLKTVGLLKNNPTLKIKNDPGFRYFCLPMLADIPPFNNSDIRQAFRLMVDRQEIIDKLLFGFGQLGNDIPVTPNHRFFNTQLQQRQFDPEKAKYHLAKAGASNLTFELHASDAAFDGAVDAAVLYQISAAKAGVDLKIRRHPVDGFFANVWKKVPFCTSYSFSRATEDQVFSLIQSNNETRWVDERIDKLLVSARGELKEDLRREMYFEMQQIMWERGSHVMPVWMNNVTATNARVSTPDQIAVANELDDRRLSERWWIS